VKRFGINRDQTSVAMGSPSKITSLGTTRFLTRLSAFLGRLPPGGKVAVMISTDALCLPVCMFVSVTLRLGAIDMALATSPWEQAALSLMALPIFAVSGVYNNVIRYWDLKAAIRACMALLVALTLVYGGLRLLNRWTLPATSVLIFWFVASAYLFASRLGASALLRMSHQRQEVPRIHLAIYGAGDAGVQFVRAMQSSRDYKPVCFLDDDRGRENRTVAGLPVYGLVRLDEAVTRHTVAQILVAVPSATPAVRRQLIGRIEQAGLPIKTLASLAEIVEGQAPVNEIREVEVEDLLGRDPVPPDPSLFSRCIQGRVVLVTGAGGSIGSELCRQIASQQPARLILLEHSEFALYEIDQEMARLAPQTARRALLGSTLDFDMLSREMLAERVDTVYHAAAYKHVPLVEDNMLEGVRNNVFGTWAVARACEHAGVRTCVLVSTDKAVRPTSLMGASKRIAELVFQAAALRTRGTVYAMVRFGNVLGSSGSVVPLFRRQIRAGGPVTITHPEVTRYFMLIPEAAQLVIQAGALARGGEVFVLDMGQPVRIVDLARSMIRLSGLTERTPSQPDGDIQIQAVGLRPGEKLYEELLIGDDVVPSGHPRILCARERHMDPASLDEMLDTLRDACDTAARPQLLHLVRRLVPEYQPADEGTPSASPSWGVLAG
jgi:FlaA1/EpsC-like NDP-sugar epimerase